MGQGGTRLSAVAHYTGHLGEGQVQRSYTGGGADAL